jgi:hypothetical protein
LVSAKGPSVRIVSPSRTCTVVAVSIGSSALPPRIAPESASSCV